MRCSEVKELLSSYVDGMLPAGQMQAVDEHLSLCPSCQEELQLLEQTINLLRDLPEIEPPEDLTASIMAGLPQPKVKNKGLAPFWRKFKGRPLGGWAAAAACFLLIAVIAGKVFCRIFLLGCS
jgi:anti-sigma factor RsiW